MTNKEILEKAIQKAIDGGWDGGQFGSLPLDLNRWRFDSGYNAFGVGQYEFEVRAVGLDRFTTAHRCGNGLQPIGLLTGVRSCRK